MEAAPVAKQAAPAKHEGPGPRLEPALAPPVAQKIDKAKKAKAKRVAPTLAPEFLTRSSKRSNKGIPPPRLGFQIAILIIAILHILFGNALEQDVINLPAFGAVAEIYGKVLMDKGPSLLSIIMRLEIDKENIAHTNSCYDYAVAIIKNENSKQPIPSCMDADILITVTRTENNQSRKRRFLPLLLGIGAVASAILSACTAIYI